MVAPRSIRQIAEDRGLRRDGDGDESRHYRQAQQWFGINVISGPIEYAANLRDRYDVILMFDVIEHFANPVATVDNIVRRLSDGGVLVIQTPMYERVTGEDWRQFNSPEHTFIFSRKSIRKFLKTFGLEHVAEETAIFPDDMFVFASRQPLSPASPKTIADKLMTSPDGRLALAMQDLYGRLPETQGSDRLSHYDVRTLGKALMNSTVRALKRRFT